LTQHRHAASRYNPEHFSDHRIERDLNDDPRNWDLESHHDYHDGDDYRHQSRDLPVHDRFGERAMEHNPMHQEFVHGTNYEISRSHDSPVIEHNSHAYPTLDASDKTKHPKAAKASVPKVDIAKLPTTMSLAKLPAPKIPATGKDTRKTTTAAK
jgi:phospholipase C